MRYSCYIIERERERVRAGGKVCQTFTVAVEQGSCHRVDSEAGPAELQAERDASQQQAVAVVGDCPANVALSTFHIYLN